MARTVLQIIFVSFIEPQSDKLDQTRDGVTERCVEKQLANKF